MSDWRGTRRGHSFPEWTDIHTDAIKVLDEVDRTEDVIGVLKNIANGKLKGNIALHCLLGVGQFLRQSTVYSL